MKVDDKQWKVVFDRIPKDKLEKMVILFLLGIFFLLVSNPLGNTTKKKTIVNQENEEKKEENMSNDAYIEMLENKLEQTIEGMEGAGRVHVMITLENGGEKILDKNQPYESSMEKVKEDGKESEHSTMQSDSETVLIDVDGNTGPIVIQERYPEIAGVVVVCEGGDNTKLSLNIKEAIQALFSVDTHKVVVCKLQQ